MDWIDKIDPCAIVRNPNSTELVQLVVYFAMGLALGANSTNILMIIISIIIYELIFYFLTAGQSPFWRPEFRLAVNCAYFMGVMIGDDIVYDRTSMESLIHNTPPIMENRGRSRMPRYLSTL